LFPTMDDWFLGNTTYLNMTVTQELKDAGVFRRSAAGGIHFIGLNIFRYMDNLLVNFNDTQPYYRSNAREIHIVDLPDKLPLSSEFATSKSEDAQDLNVTNTTTGEIIQDSTNVISTAIMNNTGVMPPSGASTRMMARVGSVFTILALVTVASFALI